MKRWGPPVVQLLALSFLVFAVGVTYSAFKIFLLGFHDQKFDPGFAFQLSAKVWAALALGSTIGFGLVYTIPCAIRSGHAGKYSLADALLGAFVIHACVITESLRPLGRVSVLASLGDWVVLIFVLAPGALAGLFVTGVGGLGTRFLARKRTS